MFFKDFTKAKEAETQPHLVEHRDYVMARSKTVTVPENYKHNSKLNW